MDGDRRRLLSCEDCCGSSKSLGRRLNRFRAVLERFLSRLGLWLSGSVMCPQGNLVYVNGTEGSVKQCYIRDGEIRYLVWYVSSLT